MTLWLDFATNRNYSKLSKILLLVVTIVFGGTIAYSRIILGAHSINQVLYGSLLGMWCAITIQFCLKEQLLTEVELLLTTKVSNAKSRLIYSVLAFGVLMAG